MTAIVWLRRDLRVRDHPALTASTVLIAATVLGQFAFLAALKSRPMAAE